MKGVENPTYICSYSTTCRKGYVRDKGLTENKPNFSHNIHLILPDLSLKMHYFVFINLMLCFLSIVCSLRERLQILI